MTSTDKETMLDLLRNSLGRIRGIEAALKDDGKEFQERELRFVEEVLNDALVLINNHVHVEHVDWRSEKPSGGEAGLIRCMFFDLLDGVEPRASMANYLPDMFVLGIAPTKDELEDSMLDFHAYEDTYDAVFEQFQKEVNGD